MINVWIPTQNEFGKFKDECKILYEKSQDKIGDPNSFEFIVENTFFFLFEYDNKLIGAIYYFKKDDTLLAPLIRGECAKIDSCIENWYLNGFAKRKMHYLCIECLKMSLNWFKGSIYAEAQNRASALCLLRCGFKRVEGKLFKWKMEN